MCTCLNIDIGCCYCFGIHVCTPVKFYSHCVCTFRPSIKKDIDKRARDLATEQRNAIFSILSSTNHVLLSQLGLVSGVAQAAFHCWEPNSFVNKICLTIAGSLTYPSSADSHMHVEIFVKHRKLCSMWISRTETCQVNS